MILNLKDCQKERMEEKKYAENWTISEGTTKLILINYDGKGRKKIFSFLTKCMSFYLKCVYTTLKGRKKQCTIGDLKEVAIIIIIPIDFYLF